MMIFSRYALRVQLFLLALILGFLLGPKAMRAIAARDDAAPAPAPAAIGTPLSETTVFLAKERPSAYADVHLEAKSAYVWDITARKKLYGTNDRAQLPLASITKMMMATVARETLPSDAEVTIRAEDLLEEGDSGLAVGEIWNLSDLIDFTLISSSNDGASALATVAGATLGDPKPAPALAKRLFVKRMNDKAKAIGLDDTFFMNESGLDVESVTSGGYGSARDVGMLFDYIWRKHPDLFRATSEDRLSVTSRSGLRHHVANTNAVVEEITGIVGSKTGYTDLAGGNLAVVVDVGINHPVAIVVLGSTREGRFADVQTLARATVSAIGEPYLIVPAE